MNKYSDKSDFEINKAVAAFNGMVRYNVVESDEKIYTSFDEFDPCNNPADAMPIVIENGISLTFQEGFFMFATYDGDFVTHDDSPYRAAMEVFLMMKEAENEKV